MSHQGEQNCVNLSDRVHAEASRVRAFIESHAVGMTELLEGFPTGCCGNASDLLGEWLEVIGFSNVEYVHGCRSGKSHGWLELDGLVIDITSDQFDDGLEPVYVGSVTSFHRSFIDQVRSKPCVGASLKGVGREMQRALREGRQGQGLNQGVAFEP